MKSKRRRRYKKKKYDLFLISKIALICYLAIFGVGYMSSNTTAYYSSQSEVSQIITAGTWEVPEVLINGCGEEDTIDEVSNEAINVLPEDKEGNPIEESEKDVISSSENKIDCGDKEDASSETGEKDAAEELVCEGKDEIPVEEKESDAASSEEVKADCEKKDGESVESVEPNKEIEKEKVPDDIETIEPIIEELNEIENEGKVNVDDSKVDDPQKSNDESQIEPDFKDESVKESKDENLTEEDSKASENNEVTDSVK